LVQTQMDRLRTIVILLGWRLYRREQQKQQQWHPRCQSYDRRPRLLGHAV
jgi:hypothetical protein